MKFNITREQAIKIICKATDYSDPFWSDLVDAFYDEKTDTMPTIYDVLRPLGITKEEIDTADGVAPPSLLLSDLRCKVTISTNRIPQGEEKGE